MKKKGGWHPKDDDKHVEISSYEKQNQSSFLLIFAASALQSNLSKGQRASERQQHMT